MSPFMLPLEAELLDCVEGLEAVDLVLLPHAAATSASAPAPPPPIIFRNRRRDAGSRCSSSSAFTVVRLRVDLLLHQGLRRARRSGSATGADALCHAVRHGRADERHAAGA